MNGENQFKHSYYLRADVFYRGSILLARCYFLPNPTRNRHYVYFKDLVREQEYSLKF